MFYLGLVIGIIIGLITGLLITKDGFFKVGSLFKNLNLFSNNSQKNSNNKVKDNKGSVHIGDNK